MHYIERVVEIDAPVERVFDLMSDFESFPRWMQNITEVRRTGRRHTRWFADGRSGNGVEWETETTALEPDHRIAWRSSRGDIRTEGEAVFEQTRRGTTLLRVVLGFDDSDRRSHEQLRSVFGGNPVRQLEGDLDRLAGLAEGQRQRRRQRREERPPVRERPGVREQQAARRERNDDRRDGEFERALRDAERDQAESHRRYEEARERDERTFRSERVGRDRDRQRVGQLDRNYYYEGDDGISPGADHRARAEEESPRRHALTPRERDMERSRQMDHDDEEFDRSGRLLRRGVDRLMDEPPSSRWDRWQ
jgi:uncharacterized protein YndB with AHSA1/START domain